ncbi:class I SAM-dependent methyltransferase [Patescibacteria group bacterium]|nr:class I SAM-dependent methyltransferase [Patescibacteria group bacterium]MBU4022874.1 class I SAM-dependent methyltransferase [Patescibacteria group bacterium]MBU4078116.1 class I SAM-dependent methyltransferase [Patescibacteria group bacterium]
MKPEFAKYLLDKTRDDYNSIAEVFDNRRSWIPSDFKLFSQYIKQEDKILDIGCGNGRLKEILLENTDYCGIDFSEGMIERAKKRYPEAKIFHTKPFEFPFNDNSFDKVFCLSVLHHIPSKSFRIKFLKEIKRVLKPKGELFLTVWDLEDNKKARKLLFKYTMFKLLGKTKLDFKDIFYPFKNSKGEVLMQRYVHNFSLRELKKFLQKAGFIIKKVEKQQRSKKGKNFFVLAENLAPIV